MNVYMRRPRPDAVLLNLPEEQPANLADWLLSGVPYHDARARVEKEFGVSLARRSPAPGGRKAPHVPFVIRQPAP